MQVIGRYGLARQSSVELDDGATVGTLYTAVKETLHLGDNVDAIIDGSVRDTDSPLRNGDVVYFEPRACEKG